jgi:MFS family permease
VARPGRCSAIGDWLGFVAIVAVATRISGSAGAISLVMSARLVPGFFLAPVAGVLVDRLDRKKIMVACDLVRRRCCSRSRS